MRPFTILLLIIGLLAGGQAATGAEHSPYVEIKVNGLEEVAPSLDRLADAAERLSQTHELSDEDKQKVIAIIGELKTLGNTLDHSMEGARRKLSSAQAEIRDSLRQLIIIACAGFIATLIIVTAAVMFLFRLQLGPLINTTAETAAKVADALDHLSATAEFIASQNEPKRRRFARKPPQNR
jgi:hypothetical protein